MPYINQKDRAFIEDDLAKLVVTLKEVDGRCPCSPGLLNYAVTRLVLRTMCPGTWSYSTISSAIRILEDAAKEMRRRLLDPYEDKAIQKNGDIPEYEE
jgi:hypothetical protein